MFGYRPPVEPRPMEPNGTCRFCAHCLKHTKSFLMGVCLEDGKVVEPWGKCPSFELRGTANDAFGIYRIPESARNHGKEGEDGRI